MSDVPLFTSPHRRYDPLTGEWVLVSAHRTDRPWQGSKEVLPSEHRPRFDPGCYLCPGATRAGGKKNPKYDGTHVFTNDFPALLPDVVPELRGDTPLFRAEREAGTCRVICFSPRHDLTLPEMDPVDIEAVVDVWAHQTNELGSTYRWVQVFENKGEAMGASNPHPHGQIWAGSALPTHIKAEDAQQREYHETTGSRLLLDYAEAEVKLGERTVVETEHWLAVVPYWAVWPFETLLIARHPLQRLPDLGCEARTDLALALQELLIRYDNLFEHPFPYSMGWHGAPFGDHEGSHWQLHAHFYPPLLRSATVRKFMVGYELLAEVQRDITAEDAAARLQAVSATHYRTTAAER
jgi:UDPglucose--hexose-1-phosphate uridylyltransferase